MRKSNRRPGRMPGAATRFPPPATVPNFIDSSIVSPRADMSGEQATRQMARDMQEAAFREGGMTRDALELLGWSAAQIDTLVPAARAAADRLANVA